ncbi:signaling lymphocytic activation molecule-like isoform X2 [Hemiscyllium ocellatum]|uniref:signaling lymphocytic activation molecule-like isoform X2 n=1 Tax=Hemiscyllium ocellatum TaxID=170820 RepID=UPI002965FB18|nr:signaling lymphocytic activation molecule-like isoform X2 [Hemiscyllium ocellatum]
MELKAHTASLLASLLLLFTNCIQAGEEMVNVTIEQKQQNVTLGGSVRLAVRMEPVPTSGTVVWRHRGAVPVKIAEITLQTNASRVHEATPYAGRSRIWADASLEIGNLTWEDRGEYAVTLSVGPWEPTDSVNLRVFEPIRRTVISIVNVSSTNQSCVATFSCSAEGGSAVQYSWRDGAQQESVLGRQQRLQLSLNGSTSLSALVCVAWNPVSSRNDTFNLTKACVAKYPESVNSPSKSLAGRFTESKGPSPQVVTHRSEPTVPPDSPASLDGVTTEYCEIQVSAPSPTRAIETEV